MSTKQRKRGRPGNEATTSILWKNIGGEVGGHSVHTVAVLAGCRKALVDTGWAISLLISVNKLCRGFVGAPFLAMLAVSVMRSVHWLENPDHCKLANEWVWQGHEL